MADPSVDDLLAELDKTADDLRQGRDVGPTREIWLVERAAAALRAQTAETERLSDPDVACCINTGRLERELAEARAEVEEVRRGSRVVIHELQSQVRNYTNALGEARAETEKLRTAIYGCGCPAPYTECPHDEPFGVQIARQHTELVEALDRLDENEGTIAALRHQLADAEARAATPQPDDDIGPLDDETRRAALEQLSTKRAAAPQPLWRGTRAGLRMINLQASYSEVPAYTRLAIYRDDQTPPGVTREQLHDAVHAALHPWMYPEDMAGDEAAAEEFEEAVPQVTDRLMALIHGEGT